MRPRQVLPIFSVVAFAFFTNFLPPVRKILLGNKCDMDEKRTVALEEGQTLADEFGIEFFETSAKSGDNVENAFFTLAKDIRARQTSPSASGQDSQPGLKIGGNTPAVEKKRGCC